MAANPSPMTLDGTRTYLVGRARMVVIDPGPALEPHLDAVADAVAGAAVDAVVPTHRHPDHAASADALAERLDAPVRAAHRGTLADGDRLTTDAGELVALAAPGHSPDHVALHWPARRAVFCGDLMMGGLETALVAAPEGDLGRYLASLERLRTLDLEAIYPAHGPAFTEPYAALDRYVRHRQERERQVLAAVGAGARGADAIVDAVYGESLEPALRDAARGAVVAYLEHLERTGRVRRADGGWVRVG